MTTTVWYEGRRPSGDATKPLVTIITPVLNGAATIQDTFDSIATQTYPNIEYLVIDGHSRDGTQDIIQQHLPLISRWIAVDTGGISGAFNFGIEHAKGEFMHIINADDWLSPNQIAQGVASLQANPHAGFVYGDLQFYDLEKNPAFYRYGLKQSNPWWLRYHMPALNHPTFLVRASAYKAIGLFEHRYKVAMDFDWAVRAAALNIRGVYNRDLLGHMRLGGVSDRLTSLRLKEVKDITLHHGGNPLAAEVLHAVRQVKVKLDKLAERLSGRVGGLRGLRLGL